MIVAFTDEAEADLERISDWIAEDNPSRATTFVRSLREKCLTLADAPLGYAVVPRYEQSSVRRRPYRDYLIFYHIKDNTIEVLHILHAAQDYTKILFPEE
jgi:plasmid stabilization system protein ParE